MGPLDVMFTEVVFKGFWPLHLTDIGIIIASEGTGDMDELKEKAHRALPFTTGFLLNGRMDLANGQTNKTFQ